MDERYKTSKKFMLLSHALEEGFNEKLSWLQKDPFKAFSQYTRDDRIWNYLKRSDYRTSGAETPGLLYSFTQSSDKCQYLQMVYGFNE